MQSTSSQNSAPAPKKSFKDSLSKVLPAAHNRIKALIIAVVVLAAFLVGMLAGAYFPWYISLVLGVALAAGGYIAMAQVETRSFSGNADVESPQ